ncbi:zinc finger protein ZAT9-like [Vicia villosa]|uniref:zinc finger protein ZAT9-like n=1 Tax=Vicia villosa TaxID=3911 RepID=UPI00273BA903|nr:zinc finger protein ZAT9-like [Vicia villosa]
MENNGRVCTICNRFFSNGKALGGHIKSHYSKLPIPPKPPLSRQVPEYSVESTQPPNHFITTSSLSTTNTRNNSIHNLRSLKRNCYYNLENFGRKIVFEFYPKKPTGKRSKRSRRQFNVIEEKEKNTQISVAGEKEENAQFNVAEENEESIQFQLVYDDHDMEAAKTLVIISAKEWQHIEEKYYQKKAKVCESDPVGFKCDICHEVFQSHQDFVGHDKMHKESNNLYEEVSVSGNEDDIVYAEVHKCMYCFEIFECDELLEKHRKVHLFYSSYSKP